MILNILFIVFFIAIYVFLMNTTTLRHTVVSLRTSWERFSLGMFTLEQVQSTFLLAMHATDIDTETLLDMERTGQDILEHDILKRT